MTQGMQEVPHASFLPDNVPCTQLSLLDDYHNFHNNIQLGQINNLIPTASHYPRLSPATSISSKGSSISQSPPPPNCQVPQVSDEELAKLSVRQLNQRLQGQDRDVVSYLKQKRRTLKNRGYALNCRVRRIQSQLQLEADNMMLKDQVRSLRQTVQEMQNRLQYYEQFSLVPEVTSLPSAALLTQTTLTATTSALPNGNFLPDKLFKYV